MLKWLCGLGVFLLASCAGPQPALDVRALRLRDTEDVAGDSNEVVRASQLKRFYGAVSMEERQQRLGDYYTVRWNGPDGLEGEPVRIIFEYRQAASGAKVMTMEQDFPGTGKGTAEFSVIGEAYQKGGRVLAWRIRLYRGGELVDTKRSYLWD